MNDITITMATAWDVSALMALLEEMQEGLEINKAPIDPLKSAYYLLDTIREGAILIAVDANGEMIGALGLRFETYWWSAEGCANDSFFFVSKSDRSKGVASLLLKQAIALCTDKNLELSVGHQLSQLDRMDVKDKWYESLGFIKTGSFFVYGGGNPNGAEKNNAEDKQQ